MKITFTTIFKSKIMRIVADMGLQPILTSLGERCFMQLS